MKLDLLLSLVAYFHLLVDFMIMVIMGHTGPSTEYSTNNYFYRCMYHDYVSLNKENSDKKWLFFKMH